MGGYWRTGGNEHANESDQPERVDQPEQPEPRSERPRFGDENTISDKQLLSFFGYKSWEDLERDRANNPPDPDECEPPTDDEPKAETDSTGKAAEAEQTRQWQTIAEEAGGEVKTYLSYAAARRDLGTVEGQQIHHVVEQSQAKPERSGFSVERINTTDNLVRLPVEVHEQISALYSRNVFGLNKTLRDAMNGLPWEEQHRRGCDAIDQAMKGPTDNDPER